MIHRLRSTLTIAVLSSQVGFAQARVVSAPPEPSLLNITRGWSRASILGDLRELKTTSDSDELRVWGGYGLATETQAVVLRRTGTQWSAFVARVMRCEIQIQTSVGDTASRATMQRYVAEARRSCGKSLRDVGAGTQIITAETLLVARLSLPDSTIERAWTDAVRAGALQLPARVERHRAMEDGFTYVVELRRGDVYRASVIEHVEPPAGDADRRIRDVYAAVNQLLQPEQVLKPLEELSRGTGSRRRDETGLWSAALASRGDVIQTAHRVEIR